MIEYEVGDRAKDYVVLKLRGELVGDVPVDRLHDALEDHYVDDGVRRIKIDLSEVDHINLEGVGMLLDLWRESRRQQKSFAVECPAEQVREKLAVTGVLRLLSGKKT